MSQIEYKKGDFIGHKYEVRDVLGKGGFGIVYLIYNHENNDYYALKTFKDEYYKDTVVRERFIKEALVWINLDRHPYIVRAHFVNEISGRLFITFELIAPDEDGLNTLEQYLHRKPPNLEQTLVWAIQFCYGMEYAYSKGIKAHRDIKPSNIMIDTNKNIKISDFGMAGIIDKSFIFRGKTSDQNPSLYQTIVGTGFGTPTHMSPEQFIDASSCDERSDVYSFGIVLYQMATGGTVPFYTDNKDQFWWIMQNMQNNSPVPKIDSPIYPIIYRCLEKKPANRYFNFRDLREHIETIMKRIIGEVFRQPEISILESWEWNNKGGNLSKLGVYEDAISCFNEAIKINPHSIKSWYNKGITLEKCGRLNDAIDCFHRVLNIDENNALAIAGLASIFFNQGNFDDALKYYDLSLQYDKNQKDVWANKGFCLCKIKKNQDAISCYNKVLELDPEYAYAWYNKALCLGMLNQTIDEVFCLNKVVSFEPENSLAWFIKASAEQTLNRQNDAISSYEQFLEVASPKDIDRINDAKRSLQELKSSALNRAVSVDEQYALYEKGVSYYNLKKFKEALSCFNKLIEIGSQPPPIWYNKALSEDELGMYEKAYSSFDKVIKLSKGQTNDKIQYAMKRLKELRDK